MMIECCLHVVIRGLQLQMYICAIEHVQLHMDCVWMFELQLTLKAPRRERVILFWLFKAWGKKSVNTVWLVLRATQRPIAFDGGTNSAGDYWPQIHNDHIYIYIPRQHHLAKYLNTQELIEITKPQEVVCMFRSSINSLKKLYHGWIYHGERLRGQGVTSFELLVPVKLN